MKRDLLLGIDFGTGGCKVTVFEARERAGGPPVRGPVVIRVALVFVAVFLALAAYAAAEVVEQLRATLAATGF